MDDQMRLYWEAYSEDFTTHNLIRTLHNPLRDYESDFVDGAIVDIGCGQTTFLFDYIDTTRKLIGIDNDQYQLDLLKNRLDVGISPKLATRSAFKLTSNFALN